MWDVGSCKRFIKLSTYVLLTMLGLPGSLHAVQVWGTWNCPFVLWWSDAGVVPSWCNLVGIEVGGCYTARLDTVRILEVEHAVSLWPSTTYSVYGFGVRANG